jgi:hypothetical protein
MRCRNSCREPSGSRIIGRSPSRRNEFAPRGALKSIKLAISLPFSKFPIVTGQAALIAHPRFSWGHSICLERSRIHAVPCADAWRRAAD